MLLLVLLYEADYPAILLLVLLYEADCPLGAIRGGSLTSTFIRILFLPCWSIAYSWRRRDGGNKVWRPRDVGNKHGLGLPRPWW